MKLAFWKGWCGALQAIPLWDCCLHNETQQACLIILSIIVICYKIFNRQAINYQDMSNLFLDTFAWLILKFWHICRNRPIQICQWFYLPKVILEIVKMAKFFN